MPPANLPREILAMMGSREHRMHHYLWHEVRQGWHRYGAETQQALAALGWEPPRPSVNAEGEAEMNNGSGEDFLYMHREMIAAVNRRLAEVADPDYPAIEGWPEPPPPVDPDWPVPPAYPLGDATAGISDVKSDAFFAASMLPYAQEFVKPERLTGWSLGELGSWVEYTIHNWMHMRWSREMADYRPEVDDDAPDVVDPSWDALSYDWLGDPYSSHVSPVFWKLHGWIDRLIDRWAQANGVDGPIPWQGMWTGPFPADPSPDSLFESIALVRADAIAAEADDSGHGGHGHGGHGGHQHGHMEAMVAAAKIVRDSGIHCHFYDPVKVPDVLGGEGPAPTPGPASGGS